MLAMIDGPDFIIVLLVILVLFGSTQIPKLARSLGSASREFKRGQEEQSATEAPAPTTSEATSADTTTAGPTSAAGATPATNGARPTIVR